jgi:two-component system response regulator
MPSTDLKFRFGSAVRARRKHLQLSQEALAERAGLHRTYVADVERGARNLSLGSIDKLARALEVSIASLFFQAAGAPLSAADGVVDILLVEDDARDADRALEALRTARLTNRVRVARDGSEALELLSGNTRERSSKPATLPRVILLDLSLPRMSSLEVLRRLKADRHTRRIPVVVLAASRRQPDVAESLQLGAETCIVKPIDFNRLADAIPRLSLCWALIQPASAEPA